MRTWKIFLWGTACLLPSAAAVAQTELPTLAPEVRRAMGVEPLLSRLDTLAKTGQGSSLEAIGLRQQVMERTLRAAFSIDGVLGRIDTEASYAGEDRYQLETRNQKHAAMLNLATFAAGGALGAAGSAMQLTTGLNHAGVALQAASGGSTLVLSAVQLKSGGGKQAVRSPYNMLAEVLGREPNAESSYPPVVLAFLGAPQTPGKPSITEGLTQAWGRLGRLATGPKSGGASVDALVADRSSGAKLGDDELADREAMLRDLHAAIIRLRTELEAVVVQGDPALEATPQVLPRSAPPTQ